LKSDLSKGYSIGRMTRTVMQTYLLAPEYMLVSKHLLAAIMTTGAPFSKGVHL
jgi:hypothetical protein